MTNEGLRWTGVFPVWWRNAFMFMKTWKSGFIPNLLQPVVYLVGMGAGVGHYVSGIEGGSYSEFIAPGLLAVSAMNGASMEATYNIFVKLIYDKLYDQLIATPINEREIVTAELLWAITRAVIYGFTFLIVAACFGLVHSWWALATIPVVALIGYFFATMGLVFSMSISTIDMFTYYFNLVLIPLFVFSDIFFSIRDAWGEIGVQVANATPLYHGVQLCRALMHGHLYPGLLWNVAYLLGFGILLHAIGYRLFVRRLHSAVK